MNTNYQWLAVAAAAALPVVIAACIIICRKMNPRRQKTRGLDWQHNRHLIQVALGAAVVLGAGAWGLTDDKNVEPEPETDVIAKEETAVEIPIDLDRADITLKEIENAPDTADTYRINALKHVLLQGLMPEPHTADELRDIFKVRSGQFSTEQQQIIDWWLNLPREEQNEWGQCEHAQSLTDFREKMIRRLDIHRQQTNEQ